MKLKLFILLFTFFLLSFLPWCIPGSFLFADTIIDSVYSDPLLDGDIIFSQNNQSLSVNNWMYDMSAGDSGESLIASDPNSIIRSYISFELPQIPDGYELDSVYVRLYKFFSVGDGDIWGNQEPFPLFYGDELPCIMDHIDYGDELDVSDWTKGDLGDPGTLDINIGCISNYEDIGYRYLNITEYVLNDYNNSRDKTQYRIRFEVNTDWDNLTDTLGFLTSFNDPEHDPLIVIYFKSNSSIDGNTIPVVDNISVFPNPIKRNLNISFSLRMARHVEIYLYNIKGQKAKNVFSCDGNVGKNEISINMENLSNGIYFLKFDKNNNKPIIKKILIQK